MNHAIPADVAIEIRNVGQEIYGVGGIGPSINQWRTWKAEGMPTPETLCKNAGLKKNSAGWALLLVSMGLRSPTREECNAANRRRRERCEEEILREVSDFRMADLARRHDTAGVPCRRTQIPIRQWNPQTHGWDTVGHRSAMTLR